LPGEPRTISGPEVAALSDEELADVAVERNIFGRMKPDDKARVIAALQSKGRYVAMVGNGVNDVSALKRAQVGISLQSGSNASRGVSDMVLIDDSFGALPKAIIEGKRTVSGLRNILKLYLTRNFTLVVLFAVLFVFLGFIPMKPIQNTFYAFVSVSVIVFFMTLFAKPDDNKGPILPGVLRFVIPASIVTGVFGLLVYGATYMLVDNGTLVIDLEHMADVAGKSVENMLHDLSWSGSPFEEVCARSAMVLFVTMVGVLNLFLVCPRWKFLSYDGSVNRSVIPLALAALMIGLVSAMYLYFPVIAVNLVGLVIFPGWFFGVLAVMTVVTFFVILGILKTNILSPLTEITERHYQNMLAKEYSGEKFGLRRR
ncbi:MAG: cation-transporting P-type ATPase, partial [Candidatus Methanomethylophilaceae archaeon]|nr:cation-transporting P-type ATPase [Candidatus Methanomethylophilaceae archaeon]